MKNWTLSLFLFCTCRILAGNLYYCSGDISYKYLSGSCTFYINYEITLNLSTKGKTAGDSVIIYYGDGTYDYIKRIDSTLLGNNIIKSTYRKNHYYPNCGSYPIYYLDTINKQSAKNLNSSNNFFFISSEIYVSPWNPPNPSFINYYTISSQVYKSIPFNFNITSKTNNSFLYDSIIYSLYTSTVGSTFSLTIPSGMKINKLTGEITWINPDTLGSYVVLVNSVMYKGGDKFTDAQQYLKFEVINAVPNFTYDSLNTIPVSGGYKEIKYSPNSTYSSSLLYKDNTADSVRLFIYSQDFNTVPIINYYSNSLKNHLINISWSPLSVDLRAYPYSIVVNARSFYGIDSVANSYQTISYYPIGSIGIEEITLQPLINLYPSPTLSNLHISSELHFEKGTEVEIMNTLGQTVLKLNYSDEIDVSSLSQGCYTMKIISPDKRQFHSKFLKD